MKYRLKTLTLFAVIFALNGCVIAVNTDDEEGRWGNWRRVQERNLHMIHQLEMGRSIESVRAELGEPEFVDSFMRDGMTFRVLYYRTHRIHDDGKTTRDETTPLVFIDGSLVGWGPSAMDQATM